MRAEQLQRTAQARLRDAVGGAVAGILGAITLERSQQVRDGYALATSRVVSGGQRQAARFGATLTGAYMDPADDDEVDVDAALGDRLMTPESDGAVVGLLRMWSLLDGGTAELQARAEAGSFAAGLAESDVTMAARVGQEEGARASATRVRWYLDAGADACDWCQMIADGGARYYDATTVPFHERCKCAVDFEEEEIQLDEEEQLALPGLEEGDEERQLRELTEALERVPVNGVLDDPLAESATRDILARNMENIRPEVVDKLASITVDRGYDPLLNSGDGTLAYYRIGDRSIHIGSGEYTPEAWAAMRGTIERGWFTPDDLVDNAAARSLTHEMGHFLDYGLTDDQRYEMRSRLGGEHGIWTTGGAKAAISQYGGFNDKETIAEAWAEYKTSPNPRGPAQTVGRYLEDKHGRNPSPTPTLMELRHQRSRAMGGR